MSEKYTTPVWSDTFRVTDARMTLRDYFAGQALAGLSTSTEYSCKVTAKLAYTIADEMLAERSKTNDK